MAQATTQVEQEPLWVYVPVRDHVVPRAEIEQQVRTGLARLWGRIRGRPDAEPDALEAYEPYQEAALQHLIPSPDWEAAAPALRDALASWLETAAGPVLVLGAPYSGRETILRAWARENDWRIIEPPPPEQILSREAGWLSGLADGGEPWVLPRLERCYLRHPNGLALARGVLDAWTAGALGRGLVGCDPWAWAYLQRVWPGRIPTVLTLQAFDADRLARWFRALASDGGESALRFRQSDSGKEVMPSADAGPDGTDVSPFLRHLAAYSLGIPGVAWDLWRRSLLHAPDPASDGAPEPRAGPERIVGVRPWGRLERPALPSDAGRDEAFILQALLLHGGLPGAMLTRLLPLASHAARQVLHRLRDAGMVTHDGTVWQVSPSGYPAARQFLHDAGYLTD